MTQAALIATDVLAGPFLVAYKLPAGSTYDALGVIAAGGVRHLFQPNLEMMDSDQYGEGTWINGLYKGGNHFVEFVLKETNKATAKALAYPFNTSSPGYGLESEMGVVGGLTSAMAGELKLSPIAGTPAASETNPFLTFGCVHLAPGHSIDFIRGSKLKEFPIRLVCLPYTVSAKQVWFTRASS